ncbi:carboxypeptidase-like regulatory domain-containing protein, partial [bacterium]|nr:carboxypeptidase-like regulatory domain-containing protein [bacterium]
MCYCKRIRLILILTLGLVLSGSATAQVTVDPIGFSAYLEGEAEQVNLILTNNGNDAIAYTIDYDLIKDEEDRNAGPRRDELGDAINDFQFNAELWTGLAWDGNLMWGVDYSTGNMIGVDLEGEIREEARINSGYTGLCWDGDGFWASSIDNNTLTQIDNEFDVVQSIRINQNMIFGVAWDGENLWYSSMSENDESTVVFQINLDGEVLHSIDCRNINSWICAVAWVPDHGDAPLWILGSDTGVLYQVNPEEDRMDDVQSVNLNQGNLYGLEHDGENLWYSSAENRWYVIDDGIIEFNMLTAEPETGVINGNDEEAIQITLDPTECEAGLYNILVTIELTEPENDRDDFEPTTLFISVVASVENDVASISGTVTDASNDGVVSNTTISMDRYIMTRFTDEEGYYSFNDLPPGEYQLDFSAVDFLPTTETVEITDEDIDLNVSLLHSECTPSERQFTMQLEPGYTHEFEFQVDNGGNGPLTYAVDRRLLGDANAEPFELRQTDEIQDACGDDMLAGAVFAEEQFFISGGNNGGNPNKIYILNADREVVGGFDQFVEDRYGMRDLAYDGELIWGAVEGTFYGFTTTGDLEIEFSVDANLEGRALAWDPVDEVLLASDISTDIFAINRDGDVVETYNRPDELRIYGLGVWPDDPDDCYLYVFCRGPDNVGINVF